MLNKSLFSSNSIEWATPIDLFNSLNEEFNFTLDPCASDSNFKCAKYFTIKDNGLIQDWANNVVFCNPPYGKDIFKWVEKCFLEYKKNNITIVMLLPVRTDTRYFHEFILPYCEIRFLKGRLHFNNSKFGAPFPSMICIFRKVDKKNE